MADEPENRRLPVVSRPKGRPTASNYDHEAALRLCDRLSGGLETMTQITADPEMPSWNTVRAWQERIELFNSMYARAWEAHWQAQSELMLEIAARHNEGEIIQETWSAKDGYKRVRTRTDRLERDKLTLWAMQQRRQNYLNNVLRKSDPAGGESAEEGLSVRVIGGLPDE